MSSTAGGNAFVASAVGEDVNSITGGFLNDLRKGNFTVSAASASASVASNTQVVTGLASNGSDVERPITVPNFAAMRTAGFGKVGDTTNVYVLKK